MPGFPAASCCRCCDFDDPVAHTVQMVARGMVRGQNRGASFDLKLCFAITGDRNRDRSLQA